MDCNENVPRRKRRSSILKPRKSVALDPDDDDDPPEISVPVRRVSFAANNTVKPFAADPDKITIWDTTYEEEINHTDSTKSSENTNPTLASTKCLSELETVYGQESMEISSIEDHVNMTLKHSKLRERTVFYDKSQGAMELTLQQSNLNLVQQMLQLENVDLNQQPDMSFTCQFQNPIEAPRKSLPTGNVTQNIISDMSMTCRFPNNIMQQQKKCFSQGNDNQNDMSMMCHFQNPVQNIVQKHSNSSQLGNITQNVQNDMSLTCHFQNPVQNIVQIHPDGSPLGSITPNVQNDMSMTCRFSGNMLQQSQKKPAGADMSLNCRFPGNFGSCNQNVSHFVPSIYTDVKNLSIIDFAKQKQSMNASERSDIKNFSIIEIAKQKQSANNTTTPCKVNDGFALPVPIAKPQQKSFQENAYNFAANSDDKENIKIPIIQIKSSNVMDSGAINKENINIFVNENVFAIKNTPNSVPILKDFTKNPEVFPDYKKNIQITKQKSVNRSVSTTDFNRQPDVQNFVNVDDFSVKAKFSVANKTKSIILEESNFENSVFKDIEKSIHNETSIDFRMNLDSFNGNVPVPEMTLENPPLESKMDSGKYPSLSESNMDLSNFKIPTEKSTSKNPPMTQTENYFQNNKSRLNVSMKCISEVTEPNKEIDTIEENKLIHENVQPTISLSEKNCIESPAYSTSQIQSISRTSVNKHTTAFKHAETDFEKPDFALVNTTGKLSPTNKSFQNQSVFKINKYEDRKCCGSPAYKIPLVDENSKRHFKSSSASTTYTLNSDHNTLKENESKHQENQKPESSLAGATYTIFNNNQSMPNSAKTFDESMEVHPLEPNADEYKTKKYNCVTNANSEFKTLNEEECELIDISDEFGFSLKSNQAKSADLTVPTPSGISKIGPFYSRNFSPLEDTKHFLKPHFDKNSLSKSDIESFYSPKSKNDFTQKILEMSTRLGDNDSDEWVEMIKNKCIRIELPAVELSSYDTSDDLCKEAQIFIKNFCLPKLNSFDMKKLSEEILQQRKSLSNQSRHSLETTLFVRRDSQVFDLAASIQERVLKLCSKQLGKHIKIDANPREDMFIFSTLNAIWIYVKINEDSGQVLDMKFSDLGQADSDLLKLSVFIKNYVLRRLSIKNLSSFLGEGFDILSLLDYIYITVEESLDFQKDYLDLSMSKEFSSLTIRDDLVITLKLYNLNPILAWKIDIDMPYINKLHYKNIKIESVTERYKINEVGLKNVFKNVEEGRYCLRTFLDSVYHYFGDEAASLPESKCGLFLKTLTCLKQNS